MASAHPDKVIPIAIDSADVSGNQAAAKIIEEKAGKLDVVIANAGESYSDSSAAPGLTSRYGQLPSHQGRR